MVEKLRCARVPITVEPSSRSYGRTAGAQAKCLWALIGAPLARSLVARARLDELAEEGGSPCADVRPRPCRLRARLDGPR